MSPELMPMRILTGAPWSSTRPPPPIARWHAKAARQQSTAMIRIGCRRAPERHHGIANEFVDGAAGFLICVETESK